MTNCFSRKAVPALFLLAGLFAAGGCGGESGGAADSQAAPGFELKDLAGKTVSLSDFRGKVVLLDFWATYCVPCHDSIPAFQRMYDDYRGKGFEVVGISVDAFVENVPEFVEKHGMRYTVVLDAEGEVKDSYQVRGLPATYLIDRTGNLVESWTGYDAEVGAEIHSAVQKLLG